MPNRVAQLLEQLKTKFWVIELSLTLYYLSIILILIWMYGPGNFSSPAFIYQGF